MTTEKKIYRLLKCFSVSAYIAFSFLSIIIFSIGYFDPDIKNDLGSPMMVAIGFLILSLYVYLVSGVYFLDNRSAIKGKLGLKENTMSKQCARCGRRHSGKCKTKKGY